ncbi:DNA polymerase I [gamma proteobacterium HTCC5015]|nr:DNA polymerase I [gamma proteobacterium HTCC5015]
MFRAFHALPPLTNSKGAPTGAVKGVINMIRSLMKGFPESRVIVVFDAKGPTFRNEIYAEYKANRPPMPDDLRVQIEPIHEIIRAMGLPLLIVDGVEADDVIGTLAKQATDSGQDALVSTGDKDMAQLVSPHVTLMNTMTNTTMDRDGVIEKFGIPPERIIDYLALVGDKVDNIPGVHKCGPKTALKWLEAYDSMQGVIDHAEEIKGKIGEYLREAVPTLPMSYDLATIRCELELPQSLAEIQPVEADRERLLALFKDCEFKTWIRELEAGQGAVDVAEQGASVEPVTDASAVKSDALPPDYEVVLKQDQLDRWLVRLAQFELFSFDTETTSLNYMQAEIVGVSFAVEYNKAAYVPLGHDYPGAPEQLDRDAVLNALKPLLEDTGKAKVGQHLKYDKNVLARYGIELKGIAHDTMLASYVLNSVAGRHDMDSLAERYLDRHTVHYEDIAGKGAKQLTFNQIDLEQAAPYAAEDADITLQLHRELWPKLQTEPSLERVYQSLEVPLVDVLARIEQNGVKVDADALYAQSQELAEGMRQAEEAAHNEAGESFNLGSPKQLQAILFEKQGLPVVRKTPKGQPSTAEDVLEELAAQGHPLPQWILRYRALSKLKSTYTDKLPQLIDSKTGRVHTSYHQAVAATGRLSSSDPNLQNIPIRSEEGRRIREAFVAEPGHKILAADYSQIELRIMAHLSGDETLIRAFKEGRDIHQATASEVFGVPLDEVESEQRRRAKAVNFGLIYGMSAFGLAKQLGISRGEAQGYVDTYFERYPGVRDYMERTREQAREQGYVETEFGRRLYLPEIQSRNVPRRQHAERTAINAPMQGTAADIIKRAMIAIHDALEKELPDVRMVMQVHDELVFEVPEDQAKQTQALVETKMVEAADLRVALDVESDIADSWGAAH